MCDSDSTSEIRLERRSPTHLCVAVCYRAREHLRSAEHGVVDRDRIDIAANKDVGVVVFRSAIEGFFLTHYDFLATPKGTLSRPGPPACNNCPTRWRD